MINGFRVIDVGSWPKFVRTYVFVYFADDFIYFQLGCGEGGVALLGEDYIKRWELR